MTDRYGKRLAYAGGLVLTACFVAGALLSRSEAPTSPASSVSAEPELFSFIRAYPNPAGKPAEDKAVIPDPFHTALPALRSMFDAILLLHADASAHVARMHAERELKARLAPEYLLRGMDMFDRYLRFCRESEPVQAQVDAAADLAGLDTQLRSLDMLRARYFSPGELAALFSNDHAYERMLLARMEIREKPARSEEERFARLQALEASISAEVRAVEDLRSRVVRADMQLTNLADDGEEDVYRRSPAGVP